MRYNFCTLFDRNYLFKGLALHGSLMRHCHDFTLWVLCMDDLTFDMLEKLKLQNAVLIKYQDFEDEGLFKARSARSVAEYCWTCTPSLPRYVLRTNPSLDMVTYLDADLFFYGDPAPVYEELGEGSIMIIEHRFPPHMKHLEVNGIYNVEMVAFRNDLNAIECLEWWRDRCLEWCYNRSEDGKFGDQKYLDDWPVRFKGVHVLKHKGAGLALWNIMRYDIKLSENKVSVDGESLIFYHFHQFDLMRNGAYNFGDIGLYRLTEENVRLIYAPYIAAVEAAVESVMRIDPGFRYGFRNIKRGSIADRIAGIPKIVKDGFARINKKASSKKTGD